jgi:hypothetical protein
MRMLVLMLQRSKYNEFLRHIYIQHLTKTFQDAIFATIRHKFSDIWIYSLCIIHHDLDD